MQTLAWPIVNVKSREDKVEGYTLYVLTSGKSSLWSLVSHISVNVWSFWKDIRITRPNTLKNMQHKIYSLYNLYSYRPTPIDKLKKYIGI
jgi:hypothetical protein